MADYKGRAAMAEGEAFEATPANIEARVQREDLPEGIKVTLLPKKSRSEEAHLSLTLHYGNEENLKGYETAAGFLPELMMRGTKKLTYQQLRDELDRLDATLGTGGGGGGRRGGGRGRGGSGRRRAGLDHFFDPSQTRHAAGRYWVCCARSCANRFCPPISSSC